MEEQPSDSESPACTANMSGSQDSDSGSEYLSAEEELRTEGGGRAVSPSQAAPASHAASPTPAVGSQLSHIGNTEGEADRQPPHRGNTEEEADRQVQETLDESSEPRLQQLNQAGATGNTQIYSLDQTPEFSRQGTMQGGQGNIGIVQNSGRIDHLGHNFYYGKDQLQSIAARTSANLERACPQGYVKTSGYYRALGEVKKNGCCIITGTSGSGKTTLARHLLLAFHDKGFLPLEFITPDECQCVPWQKVGDDNLRLVLLVDNVVGAGNFEDELRRKWEIQLKPMKPFIERGHVIVILASRANIYAAIRGVKGRGEVLYEASEVSLDGTECQLTAQEREEILRRTLAFHRVKIPDQVSSESVIEESESVMKIGFPQLCVYLATSQTALSDPVIFLRNPVKFLEEEFRRLMLDDRQSYFVLILVLLLEGTLSKEFLKNKGNENFFIEVADLVGLSKAQGSGKILEIAEQLCESYLEYNYQAKCFSFTHQSVWDVLFSEMCQKDFGKAVNICTWKQLVMYARTDPACEESEEFVYVVPKCDWPILAKRLLHELMCGDAYLACSHPCLQHPDFVQKLLEKFLTDTDISKLLETQQQKKDVSIECRKLTSLEGFASSSSLESHRVTIFSFQSCISYLLLRRCSSVAKHLLQSAQFQALSPSTQSQLLTEALACALYTCMSDPDMVDWLLDRGAVPSQECVRAACCAVREHVGLVKRALQWDSVLSAGLLTEMARVACQYDRPRTLERVLLQLPKSANTQAELDGILAEVILFTYPRQRTYFFAILPHIACTLSTLKKAGAQFRSRIDPHTAAGHPDPNALSEWLEHKVDLCATDEDGYTLLHHAAETGALSNVQALLDVMESTGQLAQLVNVKTRRGDTALHLAAGEGRLAVVEALQEKSADANLVNHKGENALWKLAFCREWKMEGCMSPSEGQLATFSSPHFSEFQGRRTADSDTRVKEILRTLVTNTTDCDNLRAGQRLQTSVHCACEGGHSVLVELLVERGVNVNKTDISGRTPVHCAAENGDTDLVTFLSKNKAKLDARGADGQTALHIAAGNAHLPVIEMLIQNKLDISSSDGKQRTPLQVASARGHYQVVKYLLDNGASVNIRDGDGQQPIHLGAGAGDVSTLELLLNRGACVNDSDVNGLTPLHWALKKGSYAAAQFLVHLGADVEAVDNNGNTALHSLAGNTTHAYLQSHPSETPAVVSLVKSLGCFVNHQNKDGDTPVMLALKCGNPKVLQVLLKMPCDLSISNNEGNTALHLAATQGMWYEHRKDKGAIQECVSKLIGKCVKLMHIRNKNGDVPLLLAARTGNFFALKAIMKQPVDLFVKSEGGNTILHELVCRENEMRTQIGDAESFTAKLFEGCGPGPINFIKERGLSPTVGGYKMGKGFLWTMFSEDPVNIYANYKSTDPLFYRLICGLDEWEKETDESVRQMEESLVSKVADLVDCPNNDGDTPVLIAARKGRWFLLFLFLKHKCDVKACDRRGNTLLHCLAETNPPEQSESTFGSTFADLADIVDRVNEEGDTALIVAARWGNVWLVRELIKLQCNVNIRNEKGETALFLAIQHERFPVVEMLLDQDVDVSIQTTEGNSLLHALAAIYDLEANYRDKEVVLKTAKSVIESCKSFATCPNSHGQTPLCLAFEAGNWCMADLLLEQAGPSVDCRDGGLTEKPQEAAGLSLAQEGVGTPLHGLAAYRGLQEKWKNDATVRERVSLWLKRFSHWVNHPDLKGNTPILTTLKQGNRCLVEQLLQYGAELSVTDAEGGTILHALEQMTTNFPLAFFVDDTTTTFPWMITTAEVDEIVMLIEMAQHAGITVQTANRDGKTPLDALNEENKNRNSWYSILKELWLSQEEEKQKEQEQEEQIIYLRRPLAHCKVHET